MAPPTSVHKRWPSAVCTQYSVGTCLIYRGFLFFFRHDPAIFSEREFLMFPDRYAKSQTATERNWKNYKQFEYLKYRRVRCVYVKHILFPSVKFVWIGRQSSTVFFKLDNAEKKPDRIPSSAHTYVCNMCTVVDLHGMCKSSIVGNEIRFITGNIRVVHWNVRRNNSR